jgi:hypothetical protein
MRILIDLVPKRLVDEMPPKLAEIERLALQWFKDYLQVNKFMLDDQGNVVPDPRQPQDPVVVPPALSPDEAARPMREEWRILSDNLMTLRSRIEAFYGLDPLDYTVMVGKLGGTEHQVARAGGAPTSVYDRIEYAFGEWVLPVDGLINEQQWTGKAATSFQTRFLKPFHLASRQQQAYALSLAVVAQTCHEAVTTAHRYLLNIADTCIARLNGESGGPGQADDVEALSWTSMISGALSLFPPLSAIMGTISFTTSVAGYVRGKQDEPPNEAPIEGTAAPQIIESTHQVVTTVEQGLAELDATLAGLLDQDLDSRTGFASPDLRLERPALADGPHTMETLTIDKYDVPMNPDVVVAVADVYKAGYVNLPGAAGQYTAAAAALDTCVPGGSAAAYFGRSLARFGEARNMLAGILRNTAESLSDAGAALVACATEYQLTDAEQAEYIRRVGELVPPEADPPSTPRHGPV